MLENYATLYSVELSPENYQFILAKADASQCYYLQMVCQYIKFHRLYFFDQSISTILQFIPPTINDLINSFLNSIESLLCQDIVSFSLCILITSRWGLTEFELKGIDVEVSYIKRRLFRCI